MDSLFRNSLGPTGWIVLGLIPPAIFALYFLKLKRQPIEVPSTYLWHRVVEDLHVNSLWQRLRKSLLLLLQLLMVALAMLALLRPGWQGQALEGQRFIFLVDKSASMSATDAQDGATRLDEAKQRIASLIDQLDSDMSAMIITFADQPDVVQEFTNNKRLLREALDRVQPSAGQTDLRGALELADGFANPDRVMNEEGDIGFEVTEQQDVELYIFSDGRFPSVEDFSMGNLRPQFLPIGSFVGENLAITAFNTRRNEERPTLQQAFVQVANFSEQEQQTIVEVHLNDRLLDAAEVTIPAGDVASATFTLSGDSEGALRARLDIPDDFNDRLTLDNTAYAVVSERSDGRVLLVTPGNTTLESALATARADRLAKVDKVSPDVLQTPDFQAQSQTDFYDLIVFDQCVPEFMPQSHTLFIGRLPPIDDWQKRAAKESVYGPQIIDWQRGHPLLSLLELGNIQIADSLPVRPPLGGRELIDSTQGPLFAIAPRDRYEDAVLGFEIVGTEEDGSKTFNTDWPRKHSFPGFWLNALEYFAGGAGNSPALNRPDQLVDLRVPGAVEALEVELPDATRETVSLDQPGRLSFQNTSQLGVYQVREGSQVKKRFAVNLFGRDESDLSLRVRKDSEDGLQVVESLSIGYVDIAAQAPNSQVRKELWKPLLVAALLVLMIEWYIYNRRVYI
ncbi:MAG: BatA and WFA domain-containing protein [Planctomycetota bacterium]